MDLATRRELAREALAGYLSGPAATTRATAQALSKIDNAVAVVLVEGVSDQIALETLAARRERNLEAEGVVVLPIGGAHAVTKYLTQFGPNGAGLRLAGLCDTGEEGIFRRGLVNAGIGGPRTRAEMAELGFCVCVDDLEDELIRAVGIAEVEELFESQGDLRSFRSLTRQAAWRDQPTQAQMRRFLGSGARRKLRYARRLVHAVALDRVPAPLDDVLARV